MAGRSKGRSIARKLELSEVKYRELFDSIDLCVIVLKPKDEGTDFVVKDMNASAQRVQKVRLGEVIGKTAVEAFPGIREMPILDLARKVWASGQPQRYPAGEYRDKRVRGWREGYIYKLPSEDIVVVFNDVSARIKAEEAEKEAERRYRTVADFTYDMEYWKGPDGKLLYVSPSCYRITGYTKQEFIKDPGLLDRIVAPEDVSLWKAHEELGGSFANNEIMFRIRRRDGEVRWIEHRCSAVIDENNKYQGIRGSNRDVTDRRHIEQRLTDSEERFRTLFVAAPIGLGLADLEGRFIDVNEALQNMLGYARHELIGTMIIDITHPDDRDMYVALSGQLVSGQIPGYTVEKRFIRKDGSTLWTNVTTVKVQAPDGRFLYRIGIIEDITERRQAQEALRESETKYRTLIETSGAGFASVDLRGYIRMVNESMCEMTGYQRDEVIGRPFSEFVHPDDLQLASRDFAEAVARGETKNFNYEIRIRARDGSHVWMRFNPREWRVDGQLIGMNAAMFDITDRKEAEEALMTSREHLQTLFMNMTQAVGLNELVVDESGNPVNYRLIDVNPEYERIFGKQAEEIRGRLVTDIYPVAEPPFISDFAQVAFSRVPARFETYYAWARKFVDVSIVPWEEKGFATIVTDITERVLLNQQLQQSEQKFSAAFMSNPDAMGIAEMESSKFIEVNQAMASMTGRRREDMIGKTALELNLWVVPQQRDEVIKSLRAHKDVTNWEVKMMGKDGPRDLWFSARFIEIGNKEYLLSWGHDVTEAKRTREALVQRGEMFRLLAESTGEFIWLADANLQATYVSPSIGRLRGYDPEETMTQTPDQLMTIESWEQTYQTYLSHKADIEKGIDFVAAVEMELYCRDGSTVWVEMTGRPLYGPDRKLVAIAGVIKDVSGRKRSQPPPEPEA